MRFRTGLTALMTLAALLGVAHAQDAREGVKLPPMMRAHMLGNMRDHLLALNQILGDVADGRFDDAGKIAESRLGMSSLTFHDAEHMAPFMPKPMQDMGASMHRAASRLVVVLQDASVTPSAESMQKVAGALHAVTTSCAACHAAYRLQ